MKIQNSIIVDKIELTDHNGETIKSIPIRINATQIASAVEKKRIEFVELSKENDMEATGRAAVELFTLLFGENAMNELLDHYKDDYFAMITDISPFVIDVVFPVFKRLRQKSIDMRKKAKHGFFH